MENENILEIKNITKIFDGSNVVDNVSFKVNKGETFGIVGESGSGKTTLGRVILQLIKENSGEVLFNGQDISSMKEKAIRKLRKDMQMIFQNPYSSLSPKLTVGEIIEEPMHIHSILSKSERTNKALELIEKVGLEKSAYYKKIHEFSGGQRQRVGIARSLSISPKLIIADEPVSALDVSVQSQVLNLMKDLQNEYDLTYIFISHNLSIVKHMSDRVGVLYLGQMVEIANKHEIYKNPIHPYTKSLLSMIPNPNPKERNRSFVPTNLPERPIIAPKLIDIGNNHFVADNIKNKIKK